MLQSDNSLNNLSKRLSVELKNLSQWFKADKISFNLTKTELILFRKGSEKIDHSPTFNLDGKRLTPINTVKYFGLFLDEHLL